MAIPEPRVPDPQRQRAILRVSVAVAVISSIFAVLFWTGALPSASRASRAVNCPPAAAAPACPSCEARPAPPTVAPPQPAAAVKDAGHALERFVICDAVSGEPVVRVLSLTPNAPPTIGVHCGMRIDLIALDASDHGAPRRIATLERAAADRGLTDSAGALIATDLSGDGAIDLIAGTSRRDEQASPRGGALYEVRRTASGSFADPRLLAPLGVGAIAAFELDGAKGSDLAALHLQDARLGRAHEVILLRGGPAPVKVFVLRSGIGMDQLAAADLDLDGHPDLVLAASGRPPELVFLDARSQPRQRVPMDTAPAASLSTLDYDRDGHDDLIVGGADARVLIANASTASEPRTTRPLPALRDVAQLQVLDWNGDGKQDLVGRRLHTLLAFLPTDDRELQPIEIASWPDAEFELRAVVAGKGLGEASLVLIASPVQARGRVELWLAKALPLDVATARTAPVPDAPLVQRLALP